MLILFFGALLFAAALTTSFLWHFQRKKVEYLSVKNQRQLVWGALVIALAVGLLVLPSIGFRQVENGFASAFSFVVGTAGLLLVFSGLFAFGQRVRRENRRLAKLQKTLGLLVSLGEKFERAKNFREFCSLTAETFGSRGIKTALWKLSGDGRSLDFLSSSGIAGEKAASVETIELEKSWFFQAARSATPFIIRGDLEIYNDYYCLFSPEERMGKAVFIPILVQGNVVGILSLFFPDDEPFLPEERALFPYLSTFLGSAFQSLLASGYVTRRERQSRFTENILEVSAFSSQPGEVVPNLFTLASRALGADFLVFSVLEPKGLRVRRFTIGRSGQLLAHKIPFRPNEPNWLGAPIKGRFSCLHDQEFEPHGPEERYLHSLGVKNYVFSSFELPGRWAAGLTLGFASSPAWDNEKGRLFENLCRASENLAARFQQCLLAEESERRFLSFVENSRFLLGIKDERALLEQAGFVLNQELPVTFSRFWKLEEDTLETASFSALRGLARGLSSVPRVRLEELPWHRMALNERRMVIFNEEDPEASMSRSEKEKTLVEGVQSAVLIPMEVEGEHLGLVSLGEMRSWSRRAFTQQDLAFARGISNQVALGLSHLGKTEKERRATGQLRSIENRIARSGRTAEALELFSNLDYRINNPLTAIIGATELIRLKSENATPDIVRYLGIIEKQAGRIGETVRKVGDLKSSLYETGSAKKVYSIELEPPGEQLPG
jgi:GAF domain-containing protein